MASKITCSCSTKGADKMEKGTAFYCHTCGFSGQTAVCLACSKKCHKNHQTEKLGVVNFYCDCGSSGNEVCGCLHPQLVNDLSQETCSRTITGDEAFPQPLYQCETCGIVGNYGICEACAKLCHEGHKLSFVGENVSFFCDCMEKTPGAGCVCKAPRNMGANRKQDNCSFLPIKKEAFDNPAPFSSASEKLFSDVKKESAPNPAGEEGAKESSSSAPNANPKALLKNGFFWHCTDCGLAGKNGTICEACARNCHLKQGHNVQFGGFGKFFCVCGLDDAKQKNGCMFLSKDGKDPRKLSEELLASEQQAVMAANFQQIFDELEQELKVKETEFERRARIREQEIARLKNEGSENEQKLNSLNKEATELRDRLTCTICMDNYVNVFTEPCGHVCLCRACADTNDLKTCPLCNQPITDLKPAYLP